MSKTDLEVLTARLERLEAEVQELRGRVGSSQPAPGPPRPVEPTSPSRPSAPPPPDDRRQVEVERRRPSRSTPSFEMTAERWLAGAGIAFVVLALAFLLKLSFDRGWITPGLRLVAGGFTGAALLVSGLRIASKRPQLAEFLLGGAIAVFYLVGFAGYGLFGLLPYWVALSLMSTTTLLAIVLSDRHRSVRLAVLGVSGGFLTPFLLETGAADPTGLTVYVTMILLGGGAVFLHRGWPFLLLVLWVGGAVTLSLATMATASPGLSVTPAPVAVPLLGLVAFWVVVAASPLVRLSIEGVAHPSIPDTEMGWTRLSAGLGSVILVGLIAALLDLEAVGSGLLCMVLAVATTALASAFRSWSRTAAPAAEIAALAAAAGILLAIDGAAELPILLVEAAALFVIARRVGLPSLNRVAHLLALAAAFGFALSGLTATTTAFGLREGLFGRLAAVGVAAFLARITSDRSDVYLLGAYAGLLFWVGTGLGGLPNGDTIVTVAWTVLGAITLIGGVRVKSSASRSAGFATLVLVAVKLFVDLARLDPIVRVLMFLGFGAALLGLGYLVNRVDD